MLSSLLAVSALQTSQYWGTGQPPSPLGSAHPRNAPYQAFEAEDKPFAVAAGTNGLWEKVAKVVNREDLLGDPRFATQHDRAEHQEALAAELQKEFSHRNAEFWLAELRGCGVPSGPVNTYADILEDPHVAALNLVEQMALPDGSITPTVRYPAAMSGVDLPPAARPPLLGDGAAAVFKEWS